ncbi:Hydroxyacylglutathione hydrolase GloB [Tepidimonas thermarum]|uniref:Hydroxyacylglutathione hydrolase n=1 Tax=Tepidimonas thermarum TaxID=335431 RepID=A0A554X602_9BURK|nr:hydroxyacylglutathione hydrolase [Tepidimonas thermarum]TSE31262.1 Hydroxyacylglutathione hydrolase GloB [Tepidimonas thermarum]
MVSSATAAGPLTVEPLGALSDNYIWLVHDGRCAWVVDPGDDAPVRRALQQRGLTLQGIWITHHHADHVGGVAALRAATGCRVVGPAGEALPEPVEPVGDGDAVQALGHTWRVLAVPGHTAGHVAYVNEAPAGPRWLFCGDTLFSGGCGRLFEGTPAQMLASLDRLAALPDDTRVCCAHEYTLSNLRFAHVVEPGNPDLAAYTQACEARRARGAPTLPSTIGTERRINPFLRCREPAVRQAIRHRNPAANSDVEIFATLRRWKDDFR